MRHLLYVLGAAALAMAGLGLHGGAARPSCAAAAGAGHVAIVVEHGGGSVRTACVSLGGGSIGAAQAMSEAGIQVGTSNAYGQYGQAVCQVDGEPASYPPDCLQPGMSYWSMFVARAGGGWAASAQGFSSLVLHDGDGLGWHYVPSRGGGPPPAAAGVCPPPRAVTPPAATAPAQTVPGSTPAASGRAAAPVPAASPRSQAGASPAPPASAGPAPASAARGGTPGPGVAAGWLAASAGGGALLGLLLLQLVVPRLRRRVP